MTGHRFILVEDDADTAQALADLFALSGWTLDVARTIEDFHELMNRGVEYCGGLHDLDLPLKRSSIKPHSEAGFISIAEQRAASPIANELGVHYTPILCVSQPAKDHRIARRARRVGADDVVVKPFIDNDETLVDTVKRFLRECGRDDHARCAQINALGRRRDSIPSAAPSPPAPSAESRLTITGTLLKRNRVEVVVNGRPASMTDKGVLPLLWLLEGRLRGKPAVPRQGLGPGASDPNYRGLAVMQEQLDGYLPPSTRIYKRVGKGQFALDDAIAVDIADVATLATHHDRHVRAAAQAIARAQGIALAGKTPAASPKQGRRRS